MQKILSGNVTIIVPSSVSYETTDIPKIWAKYQYITKWALIEAVQKMRKEGYTINQIFELLRIGNKTIMTENLSRNRNNLSDRKIIQTITIIKNT